MNQNPRQKKELGEGGGKGREIMKDPIHEDLKLAIV